MALKLKKDVKKSSYYVWFLGAKESKGLRGTEYIHPVVLNLEEREKDIEPFKVTLQVSHKGLKIVQNVLSQNGKSKPKNETIKHFIPHNTITCVHQKDDVIACILLLFNPVTKCPLHVHAYRCDSLETASLLNAQLQMLIERPENQKKFAEIENRLTRPQKDAKKFDSSIGSDTGTSTRESESSEERFSSDNTRVTTLYDSVAAELRAKLNKNDVPILLPPRDYDTVHRQKGNLTGIELRRCLNTNIVGQNVKARRIESSGGSSGIGSDHAPSPDSPEVNDRFHRIDGHSTSDDDWNAENDTTLYLMDTAPTVTLHRQSSRQESDRVVPETIPKYDYRVEQRKPRQFDQKVSRQHLEEHIKKQLASRAQLAEKYHYKDDEKIERFRVSSERPERYQEHQPVPSKRHQERSRMERYQDDEKLNSFERRAPERDDGYDERYRHKYYKEKEVPVPKTRAKYAHDESSLQRYHREENRKYHDEENIRKYQEKEKQYYRVEDDVDERYKSKPRYKEHAKDTAKKRSVASRQRSPSPQQRFEEVKVSPRDRFKDAKEKFLLLERDRLEQEMKARKEVSPVAKDINYYYPEPEESKRNDNRQLEQPISPVHKEKPFIKRHDSMNFNNDRYCEGENERYFEAVPKPAPRSAHTTEEVRYRRDVPLDRYRSNDKYDPKRRSMFNLNTDDHKRNSQEIARELKRRSYFEQNFAPPVDDFFEEEKHDSFNGFSKSNVDIDQTNGQKYDQKYVKNSKGSKQAGSGYRNSYAEPKYRQEKNGNKFEVLHRTNSTVSNNGRVGIASVHPY